MVTDRWAAVIGPTVTRRARPWWPRGRAPGGTDARSAVARAAVARRLLALLHAVVAQHLRDAQAVVGEHAAATRLLRAAVRVQRAPAPDRVLVAPERQRQQLVRRAQALEAFDGDEAVDGLQFVDQARGNVQICLLYQSRCV